MGLEEKYFYSLTTEQFYYKQHGYWVREAREWERTRFISWMLWNVNVDAKHQKKTPEHLFPLITDTKKQVKKKQSAKDKAESMRQALEFVNFLNGKTDKAAADNKKHVSETENNNIM